mmetsp:Transcript_2871/g.5480  ORF Transcript_2871/g.5480 Transcript_2871/m.5480 type:complete len:258 (-) Transcript_2871:187-960(-)
MVTLTTSALLGCIFAAAASASPSARALARGVKGPAKAAALNIPKLADRLSLVSSSKCKRTGVGGIRAAMESPETPDRGWKHLDSMYGKVYDNMLFREENGWDPMGLARNVDPATVDRFRDSELVHGRIGMLAILGQLFGEVHHPLFPDATGTAWEQYVAIGKVAGPMFLYGFMAHVHIQEAGRFADRFDGIEKLKAGQEPGVYGWDPLGLAPKNDEDLLRLKNQEVNNGRLAMVAALGVLAEEARTGVPVMSKFVDL